MHEKMVILRSTARATRNLFRGAPMAGAQGAAPDAEVTVAVENVARRDIGLLARDRDVVGFAPSVPFKLIAPVRAQGDETDPAPGNTAWGVTAVGADKTPFSGKDVTVAVLDTGIDATHPAFAGVQLTQRNFTEEAAQDQHGHGTHCAGTIFGRTTDGKRIGVAPGVTRALIGKVLGQNGGSTENIVSAIEWAVQEGANVISMSLGIDFTGLVAQLIQQGLPAELATSRALEGYRANVLLFERLASFVRARGLFAQATLITAAAGNESQRQLNPQFEISVSPPAVAEGIMSVAALGRSAAGLVVAPFSNTGANLSGPGVGILSAKLGGGLTTKSGTSMATPHVAGIAALWAERINRVGGLSSQELLGRVVGSSSISALAPGFDPFDVGAGLVSAPRVEM